jgi:hypothetical protein
MELSFFILVCIDPNTGAFTLLKIHRTSGVPFEQDTSRTVIHSLLTQVTITEQRHMTPYGFNIVMLCVPGCPDICVFLDAFAYEMARQLQTLDRTAQIAIEPGTAITVNIPALLVDEFNFLARN